MEIGTVDGITGVTANGGGVDIEAHSPLTINAPVVDEGGGSIRLVASHAEGANDHLTINAPVRVSGGDGSIELIAGTDVRISRGGTSQCSL